MSSQPLKILSIFHGAVARTYGRLRYHPFASVPDLKVHLLAPERWSEYGRTIIADPGGDPGVTLHIEPIRLPRLPAVKWYAHYYPRLKLIIEEIKPDVIHLFEEPWSFVALHASHLRRKAALVLEVDQNILKRLPQPFQAIRRHVLRQTDVILARSDDAATVVRACGFIGPVKPVGYGVDRFTFSPSPSRAPRPEGSPLRIGYVGRLLHEKGICDALTAMSLARSPVEFSMMGDGEDKELFNRKIRALGLEHRVSFRGWSNSEDVAAFLRSQDVSLLLSYETPSWREQFGRVIINLKAAAFRSLERRPALFQMWSERAAGLCPNSRQRLWPISLITSFRARTKLPAVAQPELQMSPRASLMRR